VAAQKRAGTKACPYDKTVTEASGGGGINFKKIFICVDKKARAEGKLKFK
jgi:hypothetical protein